MRCEASRGVSDSIHPEPGCRMTRQVTLRRWRYPMFTRSNPLFAGSSLIGPENVIVHRQSSPQILRLCNVLRLAR